MRADGGSILVSLLAGIGVPVYADNAPQGVARPYVVFGASSGTSPQDILSRGTIRQQTYLVESYDDKRSQASQIGDTIQATLLGARGLVDGYFVHSILSQGDYAYRRIISRDGSGKFWYAHTLSYRITFEEK